MTLIDGVFTERFLAMRPFRCLTGSRAQLCHMPYGNNGSITGDDLQPLEYALMFLHMRPARCTSTAATACTTDSASALED